MWSWPCRSWRRRCATAGSAAASSCGRPTRWCADRRCCATADTYRTPSRRGKPWQSILRGSVEFGEGLAQDTAGLLTIGVAAQQHALGERELVARLPRQHVQVNVEDTL